MPGSGAAEGARKEKEMKEFKHTEKANAILLIDRDLDNKYWPRKSYDLCPDCMKMIEELLSKKDSLQY